MVQFRLVGMLEEIAISDSARVGIDMMAVVIAIVALSLWRQTQHNGTTTFSYTFTYSFT